LHCSPACALRRSVTEMPLYRKATICPGGHELTLWTARAGACDGCRRCIRAGEQVMDCRACNWYLCQDCRPCSDEQFNSLFGAIQHLFFGDVCRATGLEEETQAPKRLAPPPVASTTMVPKVDLLDVNLEPLCTHDPFDLTTVKFGAKNKVSLEGKRLEQGDFKADFSLAAPFGGA